MKVKIKPLNEISGDDYDYLKEIDLFINKIYGVNTKHPKEYYCGKIIDAYVHSRCGTGFFYDYWCWKKEWCTIVKDDNYMME